MPRIRTVKPDFFAHEELFDFEIKTGLPLRLSFIGLWTVCDREGRFKWRPRTLKKDILPHDEIDFSRVLDALNTGGLIVKYEVDGETYGLVPTFHKHQVINNKERASEIPKPLENNNNPTRDERVDIACQSSLGKDKGEMEMEGEMEGERIDNNSNELSSSKTDDDFDFQAALIQCREAASGSINEANPNMLVESELRNWIGHGCDFQADVIPAIKQVAQRCQGKNIGAWSYFSNSVFEAKARRTKPALEVNVTERPKRNKTFGEIEQENHEKAHKASIAYSARMAKQYAETKARVEAEERLEASGA